MKFKEIIILLFIAFPLFAYGQNKQIISTAGKEDKSSSAEISYSIGEVIVSSNGEGFHFPTEVNNLISSINKDFREKLNVYPNPSTNFLKVSVQNETINNYKITLLDVKGSQVVISKNILNKKEAILDLQSLKSSTYILIIREKSSETNESYKIIKK